MAIALAVGLGLQPACAERAPDPWQSYLDAAASAVAEKDDGAAMLALEAALVLAVAEDPKGSRSRLAYFELVFPHYLLDEMDAVNRDVDGFKAARDLDLTEALFPFVASAKTFGDAYLERGLQEQANASQSTILINGAQLNYNIRLSLIRKLRPAENDVLATALLDKGKADFHAKAYDLSIGALQESVAVADAMQARREALRAASRALSPAATGSKSMPSDFETDVGAVAFEARDQLVQAYVFNGWVLERSAPDKAKEAMRSGIAIGRDLVRLYSRQLVGGGRDAQLQKLLADAWSGLCHMALRANESRDECAKEGLAAYRQSLDFYDAREGEKSANSLIVARDYARFQRELGAERKASEIEQRYAVTYFDEVRDFGVPPQTEQRAPGQLDGATPNSLPGGKVLLTRDLFAASIAHRLDDRPFALIHVTVDSKAQTIPEGQIFWAGGGSSFDDPAQERLKALLNSLTNGDIHTPIVFFGSGATDWAPYNVALRAEKLGYTDVYWFRGGINAWTNAMGKVAEAAEAP